jgi:hypothetical protein
LSKSLVVPLFQDPLQRVLTQGRAVEKDSRAKLLLIIAIILLVVTAAIYYYVFWGDGTRLRPPGELAQTALSGGSDLEKQRAALLLAEWAIVESDDAQREEAREQMRRVLTESTDPDVKVAVIQGLGVLRDFESVPELLKLVKDPKQEERVRGQAGVAIGHVLQRNFDFRPLDPDKARQQRAIDGMLEEYNKIRKAPKDS